ncbi:MAG TPA: zinc ABC transporter substrate-binding protein [Alphaproteobacteria bacterium]|nr:zinc ABC transporter substrate-binding protein [Alphaproteobacteria bacterium]
MRHFFIAAFVGWALGASWAHAAPIDIVAAENFYGDVAEQIGGPEVHVTSILTNPDEDPHLFEANPSTARQLADAKLVIYSGAGYDSWAGKLLAASKAPGRQVIDVAKLVHRKDGDNPHIWYDPPTMPALAKHLADTLSQLDPSHRADYVKRLALFVETMKRMDARISELHRKYAETVATATEPVFGYMADALGLKMRNDRFQLAVMNDTEPSAGEIAAFEKDLRSRTVKVLFYNSQTSEALTERMRGIAKQAGVPIVGVTETEPPGKRYQEWMMSQLDALDQALAGK